MSLKRCPHCGRLVSSFATECPQCHMRTELGEELHEQQRKNEEQRRQEDKKGLFAALIVAAVVFALLGFAIFR